ncbi:uncharacterized protein LOC143912233 isoform X2 [Arctopsyche grandis]|uniref:uncharacterized protein LOC143912233 isoform X2 n=1 Tax=Arctopsyche grandis TaxID=121162 RepID=UPI00406D9041
MTRGGETPPLGVAFLAALALVGALCPPAAASEQSALIENVGHPSVDFSRHTIIKPKIFHGREKRQISTTLEQEGLHIHDLTISYDIDGEQYLLDLRLNRELIPSNFFVRHQLQGQHIIKNATERDVNLCQYVGKIRGVEDSWVAVSTCKGLRGVVYDGKTMHYLQAGKGESHFLYKHEDLVTNHKCGYVGGGHNETESLNSVNHEFNRILRYKRSASPTETSVRGPYNANKKSRYVELVLVVDNKEYKELGENLSNVYHHCKDIANIINSLYAPLNIFIALVGVVVWTEYDEIKLSDNGDTTLTNFLHYRRERLVKDHPNDNAQLLTREQFAGGVVGKALKGPICTYEFSGGVAMDHSNVVGLVATTVAHEMGHNFGMEHDTESCKCPDDRCIMSPSSNSQSPTHWSSCSLEYLALAFEHGMDYCLRNKPKKLFDSPICGNGFVELGEECDCGLSKSCDGNFCCNPATCMLFQNATCATGECCDLKTCRPSDAGTMCRSAEHECDLPEFCTGQSEFCPDDVFKMDTETCEGGHAFCYQGSCRTRTDQCRLLWGPSGETSDDKCYEMNRKGTRHGNCGYNRLKQNFSKCQDENLLCGMLHCRHLNERLEFGMENVAILSHSFINNKGSIIPCRSAMVDLGLNQVDPGLVPDGAKCGEGKMCVNQRCLAVDSLRLEVKSKSDQSLICPFDCNGRGVCNSLGHCHCDKGYAPPLCEYPGPGGSLDSGPASPNPPKEIVMLICIGLSGIITTVLLLALLSYYSQHNAIICWKEPKTMSLKSSNKGNLQRRTSRGASCLELCSPSNSIPTTVSPTTPHLSPDDMNSSLLPTHNSQLNEQSQHINFFGNFKGFSLTPLQKQEKQFGVSNQNFGIENENTNKSVSSFSAKSDKSNQNNVRSVVSALNSKNSDQPNIGNSNSGNSTNVSTIPRSPVHKLPQRSAPPIPSVPSISIKMPTSNKSNLHNPNTNKVTATINKFGASDKNKSIVAGVESSNTASMVPALPPANPVATNTRPVISNPILEASTCTAKELISPLKNSGGTITNVVPLRAAPTIPAESSKRPLSSPNSVTNAIINLQEEQPTKKSKDGITLNRIASFLKQEKNDKDKSRNPVERSHSLPKNQHNQIKAFKNLDKNELRTLPISNPIPLNDIDLPSSAVVIGSDSEDSDPNKSIMRAQSMRGPVSPQKPNIPAFGSMRQASGVKRPTSIPVSNRPTSPPPPRPNMPLNHDESNKTKNLLQDQKRITFNSKRAFDAKTPEYDDCVSETHTHLANINEENSSDNIYAIIEESPPPNSANKTFNNKPLPNLPSKVNTFPQTNASMSQGKVASNSENVGLLGEIVSEIQNRNLESIYSSSTLARKKKEKEMGINFSDTENDFEENLSNYDSLSQYKPSDNEYSNLHTAKSMSSAASTTSSGYLSPSAVNVPVGLIRFKPNVVDKGNKEVSLPEAVSNKLENKFSKFEEKEKNETVPYVSTLNRAAGPFAAIYNKNKSVDLNASLNQKDQNISQEIDSKNPRKISPPSINIGQPKNKNGSLNIPTTFKSTSFVKPSLKTPIPKAEMNSPDLVSSCASAQSYKSPDIVNTNSSQSSVSNTPKSTSFDQGVILKPALQTSAKPSVTTFQKPSNILTKKDPQKTLTNGFDSSKSTLRSAPTPPVNTYIIDKKKTTPPRPSLPKVLQNNVASQKNQITNNSLNVNKANAVENNINKTNSVVDRQKQLKSIPTKRGDEVSNKISNNINAKSSINSKVSNVANLQQKFESSKSNAKATPSLKKT